MSNRELIILGCSSQQPTRKRSHGAYLFRWNEEGLLFDPGEGTQRQFIFANIAPTCVNKIFISHFHGDHCLGVGSMLMRLNLDKVKHTIHCYYPESGKKNFKYLRYGCLYHENINVVEHPIKKNGVVSFGEKFIIEAKFLSHGVDTIGWRVTERDRIKYKRELLKKHKIKGPDVGKLEKEGKIVIDGKVTSLKEVSFIRKGDSIAVVLDSKKCSQAVDISKGAKLLLCESTFLEKEKRLSKKYMHMTAKDAANIAKDAGVEKLVLTHFSARYTDARMFVKEACEIFENVEAAEDFKRISF